MTAFSRMPTRDNRARATVSFSADENEGSSRSDLARKPIPRTQARPMPPRYNTPNRLLLKFSAVNRYPAGGGFDQRLGFMFRLRGFLRDMAIAIQFADGRD